MAEPQTKLTSDADLKLKPVEAWKAPEVEIDTEGIDVAKEESTRQLSGLEETISTLQDVNKARLRGEIPPDVAAQLRSQSAETALAGGFGTESGAARSLQARDFGLTSMQIQEAGIATEQAIAGLKTNLAQLTESRYQFQENLALEQRKFMEQSRQFGASLEQDALRTQIASKELFLKQSMFNAEQNLKAIEVITNLGSLQANLQVQAATSGKSFDMAPVNKIFNDLISSLNAAIKRSNP